MADWMDIDPGYPVPLWLVREAVKLELPKTLTAVRKRVYELGSAKRQPAKSSIMAANLGLQEL